MPQRAYYSSRGSEHGVTAAEHARREQLGSLRTKLVAEVVEMAWDAMQFFGLLAVYDHIVQHALGAGGKARSASKVGAKRGGSSPSAAKGGAKPGVTSPPAVLGGVAVIRVTQAAAGRGACPTTSPPPGGGRGGRQDEAEQSPTVAVGRGVAVNCIAPEQMPTEEDVAAVMHLYPADEEEEEEGQQPMARRRKMAHDLSQDQVHGTPSEGFLAEPPLGGRVYPEPYKQVFQELEDRVQYWGMDSADFGPFMRDHFGELCKQQPPELQEAALWQLAQQLGVIPEWLFKNLSPNDRIFNAKHCWMKTEKADARTTMRKYLGRVREIVKDLIHNRDAYSTFVTSQVRAHRFGIILLYRDAVL